MTEIRHIRLINGTEIMGEYLGSVLIDKTEFVRICEPLAVEHNEDGDVVLISYIPFSSDRIVLFKEDHVVNITQVHDEVVRYYNNSLSCNKKFLDENFISRIKLTNDNIESQMSGVDKPILIEAVSPSKMMH